MMNFAKLYESDHGVRELLNYGEKLEGWLAMSALCGGRGDRRQAIDGVRYPLAKSWQDRHHHSVVDG